MGALIQLARQVLIGLGVGVGIEALLPGQQFGLGTGFGPSGGGGGFLGFSGNGKRRRRRRRALTADDMRLALTIASAIGKKAAENFILQRTRAA